MKQLIFITTILFAFSSCWKQDKDIPPRLLEPRKFFEERLPVYDSVSVWSVEKKQYVKQWGIARYVVVPIKEYEVIPNGKQTMKYANLQGYGKTKYVGWLIVAFVFGLIWWAAGELISVDKSAAKAIVRGVALILCVGVGLLTITPANVAQLNAKPITEKQLKHYQSIDPELNYFWDSVYNANAILK